MPRRLLRIEDDTEGHMPYKRLDAEGTEVTVRDNASGLEVTGHLRREGDAYLLEADEAERIGEGEVTIRFKDTGEEVTGHGRTGFRG